MATCSHFRSNKERTNYARLCRAIADLCTQILRDLLTTHSAAAQIAVIAHRCPRHALNAEQWKKINDATINGYTQFDITLLCVLLRNVPGMRRPAGGWGGQTMPAPVAVDVADDIERIRIIRNQIYGHVANTLIDDIVYKDTLAELQGVVNRFDARLGTAWYQQLNLIDTDNMDDESESRYIEKIEELAKSDGEVKKELETVKDQQKTIENRMEKLELTVTSKFAKAKRKSTTEKKVEKIKMMKLEDTLQRQESKISTIYNNTISTEAHKKLITMKMKKLGRKIQHQDRRIFSKQAKLDRNTLSFPSVNQHRKDKTFVATFAVKKGLEMLMDKGALIYTGKGGCGKTKNALEVMKQVQDEDPEWRLIEINDVTKWQDKIDNAAKSVVLLDDCLGKTNYNATILHEQDKYWRQINDYVEEGYVKVVMTIRKHILIKGYIEFEKYQIFAGDRIIDLSTEQFKLSRDEKEEILKRHCDNNNISIVFRSSWDDMDPLRPISSEIDNERRTIDAAIVRDIIDTDPLIGFPQLCFMFASFRKYTIQGVKFFKNPTQSLLTELESLRQNTDLEQKLKYCIFCYMLLCDRKIDLNNLDRDTFEIVVKSVSLSEIPKDAEIENILHSITDKYVIKTDQEDIFTFQHETLLEGVALSFGRYNPEVLLKYCSDGFIKEFVRGQNYIANEGETSFKLKEANYKNLADRFISYLQHINPNDPWGWVIHSPILNEPEFCKYFVSRMKTELTAIDKSISSLFQHACVKGKTFLVDRMYTDFNLSGSITEISRKVNRYIPNISSYGHVDTVRWLWDHNIGDIPINSAIVSAHKNIVSRLLEHPCVQVHDITNLEFEHKIYRHCNKDVMETILKKWPQIDRSFVRDIFYGACCTQNHGIIQVIIQNRPDEITEVVMKEGFSYACMCGRTSTLDYLQNSHAFSYLYLRQNNENITNLHLSALFGKFDVFMKLIDLGLSIKERSKSDLSVLHMTLLGSLLLYQDNVTHDRLKDTSVSRYLDDVKSRLFVDRFQDLNSGDGRIFNFLLKHEDVDLSDLEMKLDKYGNTIAHYLLVNGLHYSDMLTDIYDKYNKLYLVPTAKEDITCFHLAALFGRSDFITKLIEQGLSVTDRTSSGLSVLQMSLIGLTYVAQTVENLSDTGLINDVLVEYLQDIMKSHIECNEKDNFSNVDAYISVLTTLLDITDVDFNDLQMRLDESGSTIAHYLIVNGSDSTLSTIYTKWPKLFLVPTQIENMTCLHLSTFYGNRDLLTKLLDLGLSITERMKSGLSVLQIAMLRCLGYQKSYSLRAYLSNIRYEEFERYLDLFDAWFFKSELEGEDMEILEVLLNHKDMPLTDICETLDENGNTFVHYCVIFDKEPYIEILRNKLKSLLDVPNGKNYKPLHLAVVLGNSKIIKRLYDHTTITKEDNYEELINEGRYGSFSIEKYTGIKQSFSQKDEHDCLSVMNLLKLPVTD